MNIAVIGIGGVGGYFGGKIANCFEEDTENKIYFIARSEHLKNIRERGLELKSKNSGRLICMPTIATDNFADLTMLDICFICVKAYDLNNVIEKIKDKIKKDTEIIPLLNGVDISKRIRKVIKNGVVYPACTYVGTHIESPGIVVQNGGSCTIKFGKEKASDVCNADRVTDLLDKANINYEWTSNNYEEIWSKYMFIAGYGLVTACHNKTLGEVYDEYKLNSKVLSIMEVIRKLALKQGVNLPNDIVQISNDKAMSFPHETKTSFQRDYEKKVGRDEREVFGGTIIELAKEYNIEYGCVEEVYRDICLT